MNWGHRVTVNARITEMFADNKDVKDFDGSTTPVSL